MEARSERDHARHPDRMEVGTHANRKIYVDTRSGSFYVQNSGKSFWHRGEAEEYAEKLKKSGVKAKPITIDVPLAVFKSSGFFAFHVTGVSGEGRSRSWKRGMLLKSSDPDLTLDLEYGGRYKRVAPLDHLSDEEKELIALFGKAQEAAKVAKTRLEEYQNKLDELGESLPEWVNKHVQDAFERNEGAQEIQDWYDSFKSDAVD